jgi:hypothetical protein
LNSGCGFRVILKVRSVLDVAPHAGGFFCPSLAGTLVNSAHQIARAADAAATVPAFPS